MDFRDTAEEASFRDEVQDVVRREPARRAPRARRRGRPLRRAGGAGVEPRPLRRGLVGDLVARGVRRPRPLAPFPGDLPRGGGARRGAAAHRRDRPGDGRADDHGPRHRRAEGALPAAPSRRGRDLVPGLLRAGRRLRPRGRAHGGAARRRPLRPRRPEGVVVLRAHRGLLHPADPLRPGLRAPRGADVHGRRHARAGRRGAPAHADHRRGRVQRDLLRGRGDPRRERPRRDRRRLGRGDDHAPPRARHARLRAGRPARGADAQARSRSPGTAAPARRSATRSRASGSSSRRSA